MNKKKKIIFISVLVIILITILIIVLCNRNNTNSDGSNITDIEYDDSSYDHDFSNDDIKALDLDLYSEVVEIKSGGVYYLTNSLDGYILVNTDENIEIILDNVTIKNNNGPCIYIESAKNTYIELIGNNTLIDGSSYSNFDSETDGTIYSKDDLIIFGDGTLNLTSNYADGIVSKDDLVIKNGAYNITSIDDAIRGKDSLSILDGTFNINSNGDAFKSTNDTDSSKGYIIVKNGTFNIECDLDAFQAETILSIENGTFDIKTSDGATLKSTNNNWGKNYYGYSNTTSTTESSKALKAGNNIVIDNGTFIINSSDDSIHSNNSILINNGTFKINSGDDGIHADKSIVINDGSITINESYEGIESNVIVINSGNIEIVSSDDGINVNGGNDSSPSGRPGENNYSESNSDNVYLEINGGTIHVNASGDGLDSNGDIYMNGGYVSVDGPTDNGNGPLDYNSSFKITGGTLIAIGSSGMAQNVSSNSSQYGVLINLSNSYSAGTTIKIDGIIEYTSLKSFSSIVVSTPNIEKTSYSLLLNNSEYTSFTVSSITTNIGSGGMGNMNGRH